MNVINKVTLAQMKLNKRRTAVTIIGVIISVAMVTAVLAIASSFTDLLKREAISNGGYWHAGYEDVTQSGVQVLLEDDRLEAVSVMKEFGFALREGAEDSYQPYWYVRAYDEAGFENFPVSSLVEGRLPEKDGEAVISEEAIAYGEAAVQVGDVLNLSVGQRIAPDALEEEQMLTQYDSLYRNEAGELREHVDVEYQMQYTIVGIVEKPYFEYAYLPGFSVLPYLSWQDLDETVQLTAFAALKHVGRDAYEVMAEIGRQAGSEAGTYHGTLLRYYGVFGLEAVQTAVYGLAVIVMGIIAIGSISLIYNAFAISVSERSRYLGMLASVGATARQKRNSVFFEALVIGGVSIPAGLFFGYLGIGVTFHIVNQVVSYNFYNMNLGFALVVELPAIVITVLAALVILFTSAWIPARRASRMAPVEAIRQTKDVKLTTKAVRTSRLTRWLFGIEGELALKNLKRNRRRYQATVFSLIISIVLFLSTGYYGASLQESFSMMEEDVDYDIMVSGSFRGELADLLQTVESLDGIAESSLISSFRAEFPQDYLPERIGAEDYTYLQVVALADENLREYAQLTGAEYSRLKDTDQPAAILINNLNWYDDEAGTFVTGVTLDAAVGEQIPVAVEFLEDEAWLETEIGQLQVAVRTAEKPMGVEDVTNFRAVAVVSQEVFEALSKPAMELEGFYTRQELYLNTEKPRVLQKEIESLSAGSSLYVWNRHEQRDQQKQLLLFVAIFVYGFITLISAVCIANIFNTISTSVALRKREFAMLRSTGMTPESFNRMISFESLFYGIKALLYGLPLSAAAMWLIYGRYGGVFEFAFHIPWGHVLIAVLAVFVFVGMTMLYAVSRIKKENIIDSLKQESI